MTWCLVKHRDDFTFLPFTQSLTKIPRHEEVRGSGSIGPPILSLGTRRPRYPRGEGSQYPPDSTLDEPQIRLGRGGQEKKIPAGNLTRLSRFQFLFKFQPNFDGPEQLLPVLAGFFSLHPSPHRLWDSGVNRQKA